MGKEEVLNFFNLVQYKCMVPLKIGNIGDHAVIFMGIEKSQYKFLNNRWMESPEPDYYWYDSEELLMKLRDKSPIGWIGKKDKLISLNNIHELELSLGYLENYRNKVKEFCCEEQDFITLEKARSSLFEAFFLDVLSMMEIIEEIKIANEIKKIRKDYIEMMKLKRNAVLAEHLSIDNFDNLIAKYMKVIESKMAN